MIYNDTQNIANIKLLIFTKIMNCDCNELLITHQAVFIKNLSLIWLLYFYFKTNKLIFTLFIEMDCGSISALVMN